MNAGSVHPLKIAAVLAGVFCSGAGCAEPATAYGGHPAVVCMAEAGSHLAVRAHGTLTRTRTGNELRYRLEVKEESYEWRFVTNDDKSTTIFGPGFLTGRFVEMQGQEKAPKFPRGPINALERSYVEPVRQSLHINGEIREGSTRRSYGLGKEQNAPCENGVA